MKYKVGDRVLVHTSRKGEQVGSVTITGAGFPYAYGVTLDGSDALELFGGSKDEVLLIQDYIICIEAEKEAGVEKGAETVKEIANKVQGKVITRQEFEDFYHSAYNRGYDAGVQSVDLKKNWDRLEAETNG